MKKLAAHCPSRTLRAPNLTPHASPPLRGRPAPFGAERGSLLSARLRRAIIIPSMLRELLPSPHSFPGAFTKMELILNRDPGKDLKSATIQGENEIELAILQWTQS
jgi:hypothetical protein